jgi:Tol biopolymer transport system component
LSELRTLGGSPADRRTGKKAGKKFDSFVIHLRELGWISQPNTGGAQKMAATSSIPSSAIEEQAVRAALTRILASEQFRRSERISRFLEYVISHTLEGDSDSLKEVCIGISVFAREAAYDPQLDPIVRVEARRLRTKLDEYYAKSGSDDKIVVRIPKGGYKPVFVDRSCADEEVGEPLEVLPPLGGPLQEPLESQENAADVLLARLPNTRLWIAAALGLAILLAAAAPVLWRRFHALPSDSYLPIPIPITSYLGEEFEPALSPDGARFALVRNESIGVYNIFVQSLSGGNPVQLTDDHSGENLNPAWSPDGRDIAFLRMTPEQTSVIVEPAVGGPERQIAKLDSETVVWKSDAAELRGSLGPAWSPDGRYLAVSEDQGNSSSEGLTLIPLGFGTTRRLTGPPGGAVDVDPSFSPDGRSIAFARESSNSSADIFIASVSNGRLRQLTSDQHDIRGLCWGPDGHSIIFSSNRGGSGYALWSVPVSGEATMLLSSSGVQPIQPSTVAGSRLLLYADLSQNTNIWRINAAGAAKPVLLIGSSGRNNSARYSQDGSRIAFVSDRSGNWELWISERDGRNPTQLTHFEGPMLGSPRWSPDGTCIAFDARPNGHSAIFTVSSAGGAPHRLMQDSFEERMPSWSPDGKYILFNSNRSGPVRLWRVSVSGGDPVRLTDTVAYDSFETKDGKWIYFRSSAMEIWRVPASGGRAQKISAVQSVAGGRYFDLEGNSLYFAAGNNVPHTLDKLDLQSNKVQPIAVIPQGLVDGTPSLSVSPDGQSILFAEIDNSGSDIYGLRRR